MMPFIFNSVTKIELLIIVVWLICQVHEHLIQIKTIVITLLRVVSYNVIVYIMCEVLPSVSVI